MTVAATDRSGPLLSAQVIGVALLSNLNNILLEHQYSQAVKGVAALLLGFEPPRHSDLRYRETYWIISAAAVAWLVWRLLQVIRLWRRQLCLRSQKTRLNWRRFKALIQRWIPSQRILHPFPRVRFDAMHPR